MGSYQQLTLVERAKLKSHWIQGVSLRSIGSLLGRSHTSLSRELRRNHQGHPQMSGYVPELADKLAKQRKSNAAKRPRLKSVDIRDLVHRKLKERWSPEQIAGAIPMHLPGKTITHEAIYQYIYNNYPEGILCLARRQKQRYPRGHRKKKRAPSIVNRVDIDERPEAVNQREAFGHWESDLIVSTQGRSAIHVAHERLSRRVILCKLPAKTAAATQKAMLQSLGHLPLHARESVTYDNGSENANHESINEALNMRSYFCKPYHSWEKGAVENSNGLIRRYIPKGRNLDTVTVDSMRKCTCLFVRFSFSNQNHTSFNKLGALHY